MNEATKHDGGKPRMDLLDPVAMEELAKILSFGAEKYGENNWRKGIKVSRLVAAMLRHTFAFIGGETLDQESGLPHIAHAMCCCMFILGQNRPDLDDRYNSDSLQNHGTTISSAFVCKMYRENATPAMCIQFERDLTEKFGPTPEHAVADEAVKLWQKIFLEVGA